MTEKRLENKVALVTGGASGIGRATVLAFAREGAKLVISDIDIAAGTALAEEIKGSGGEAVFVAADVTQEADVKRLVATAVTTFGRLDVAHNNVGGGAPNPSVTELTEAEWDWTLNLSLKSVWLCMKHELRQMQGQGSGAIVNTAALAGQVITEKASPAYSVAKAGVMHLTRFAAVTYGKHNIRVNAISPGLTETPTVMSALTPEQRTEVATLCHPIPRMVKPEEQADAVIWLCSDQAAMVNGLVVPVDGGWAAK